MKNIINRVAAVSMLLVMSLVANAQIDVDVDLGKKWYEEPIYWVLGVVVLILIVVLARRKA